MAMRLRQHFFMLAVRTPWRPRGLSVQRSLLSGPVPAIRWRVTASPARRSPGRHRQLRVRGASGVYTELFEPSLFSLVDGDEPPGRGSRHRRRRPQGARLRFGAAAGMRRARRDLRARLRRADEHRRLAVSAATNRLGLCDKIRLIPGHCDPTVNLYDWYVCVRGNRVEQIWPITARGAVY